jgi:hypothetical protein
MSQGGGVKAWIKVSWVSSMVGAITLFGVLLSLTPITRGLGIAVREGGQFFLKQGPAEMEIPQWLGGLLFVITYLFGFLIFSTLLLSLPVFLEHGNLKVGAVLDETKDRDRALLTAFRVAWVVVSIGFAVSVVTLFVRFLGR